MLKAHVSIGQIGLDAQALIEALKIVAVGETIEYKKLDAIVRGDVRGKASGSLVTARNRLERDDRIVFATVRGVGLKRVVGPELMGLAMRTVRQAHAAAGRGVRKVACVDEKDVTAEQLKTLRATQCHLAAISAISKPSRSNKIADKLSEGKMSLPLSDVLDALK